MNINFKKARQNDLLKIVAMIADDELGKTRENYKEPLPNEYQTAFENINTDKNQELIVVENEEQEIVGTL